MLMNITQLLNLNLMRLKMKTKQIPKEWKEVELGEITECLDNKRIPITESNRKNGNIPYCGANGQLDLVEDFIFNEELLLLAEDGGSWGHKQKCSYIINGKSWVNNHVHVLRVNKNLVNIKFLMYWFNLNDLNKYISGTTRGKLNQKVMNKIKIPLPFLNGKPDIQIQKAIVSILEKAEALKHQREQSDKLTKEYLQSVFYEMFSNKVFSMMKLKNLIIKTENKNPPKEFPDDYFDYIDISSVDNISKRIVSTNRTLGKDAPSRAKQQVKTKDIILSTVRPNLNAVALIPKELNNQICSTGFCVLRFDKEKAITEYIFMNLIDNKFIESMTKIAKGASYPAISDKDIFDFEIPLPPLPLQQTFASIVEQVEKLKEKQKQSKEELKIMFDSLMQKAFKGKLVK